MGQRFGFNSKFSINLYAEQVFVINELIEEGKARNASDAIRQIIDFYRETNKLKEKRGKIK